MKGTINSTKYGILIAILMMSIGVFNLLRVDTHQLYILNSILVLTGILLGIVCVALIRYFKRLEWKYQHQYQINITADNLSSNSQLDFYNEYKDIGDDRWSIELYKGDKGYGLKVNIVDLTEKEYEDIIISMKSMGFTTKK